MPPIVIGDRLAAVVPTLATLRTAGPRTRAEVIADLEVYRKSGLADLDSRDSPDVFGAGYQAAQARYQAMRVSPEFATLVSKIAKARGETVATASAGSGVVAQ